MQRIDSNVDGLLARMMGGPVLPTQREYILSYARRAWYTGPVGCAKTSSLCGSVILPALLYPGSEWLVARWTWWTLEQTTLKRFLQILKRLGPGIMARPPKVGPPFEIWLNPGWLDDNGKPKEPSHIVFHGLDDFEKLGSIELTGVAIDEVNEIDFLMANTLDERLRHRLPEQEKEGLPAEGPFFWRAVSNPGNRSSWMHKKFCNEEDSDPEGPWGTKFAPRPRENAANLPPGYYETIKQGKSAEEILRKVEGLCGPDMAGEAVFKNEFSEKMHVAKLQFYPNHPGQRWWDFGRRRPCVVWAQRVGSYVNRLAVELGEDESLEQFANRVIMRTKYEFPLAASWLDITDPHGEAKKDVSDLSSCDILRKKGLKVVNQNFDIKTGLEQMTKGLTTLVNGRPISQFDKSCQILIEGYSSGYSWPEPKPGRPPKEKPVADGYYEHPMDCDRYGMQWNLLGPKAGQGQPAKRVLRKVRNPQTGY